MFESCSDTCNHPKCTALTTPASSGDGRGVESAFSRVNASVETMRQHAADNVTRETFQRVAQRATGRRRRSAYGCRTFDCGDWFRS